MQTVIVAFILKHRILHLLNFVDLVCSNDVRTLYYMINERIYFRIRFMKIFVLHVMYKYQYRLIYISIKHFVQARKLLRRAGEPVANDA